MPKIVSSSIVSTSEERKPDGAALHVYYCVCGEYLLILDKVLSRLPRRRTDGARIIDNAVRRYKVNCVGPQPRVLRRAGGLEKQFRYACPRCVLPFLYEVDSPRRRSGPYSYVLPHALRDERGRDPDGGERTGGAHATDEAREALMRAKAAMLAGGGDVGDDAGEYAGDFADEEGGDGDRDEAAKFWSGRWDTGGEKEVLEHRVKNAAPAPVQVTAESLLR
ncbi:hypothetical protein DFJ74DRAFT_697847 [Hyaloraphidium curvatum]|nr:hypothetical protein DFJ74DRAFT_697847 [Hyaloraphidium curvatum]